jgi:hypothetical protein
MNTIQIIAATVASAVTVVLLARDPRQVGGSGRFVVRLFGEPQR